MTYQSRHVDMLESEISGKCGRTFLSIGWDTVNKQCVLGFRVYYGPQYPAVVTIYIDFETISLLIKRLPEVISILNKFNTSEIKPLNNYFAALRLSQMAHNPRNRNNWNACEFDLQNS